MSIHVRADCKLDNFWCVRAKDTYPRRITMGLKYTLTRYTYTRWRATDSKS